MDDHSNGQIVNGPRVRTWPTYGAAVDIRKELISCSFHSGLPVCLLLLAWSMIAPIVRDISDRYGGVRVPR